MEDALVVVNDVLAGWFTGCVESGCQQPGGYAVLRVGEDGHVEQLIDGEWVAPTGENAFPAVPERTEPTEDERRCLAAANAARVLQELYEQVSEVAQYDLGVAELIIRIVDGLLVYWFWIAPIINGILLVAIGILEVLLQGAKYITSDVWDTTFDDVIRCYLYECASDDGGVVTFDYDCLMNKLYEENVTPPWNEARARLAAQLALLIPVVGGVDALNQMGAVDAVESADCSDCVPLDCTLAITFDAGDSYSLITRIPGVVPTLDSGFGNPLPSAKAGYITGSPVNTFSCDVRMDLGAEENVADVSFEFFYNRNDDQGIYLYVQYYDGSGTLITTNAISKDHASAGYDEWQYWQEDIGCAGCRYVQVGFGGENIGLVAEGWLDNICINYA